MRARLAETANHTIDDAQLPSSRSQCSGLSVVWRSCAERAEYVARGHVEQSHPFYIPKSEPDGDQGPEDPQSQQQGDSPGGGESEMSHAGASSQWIAARLGLWDDEADGDEEGEPEGPVGHRGACAASRDQEV